MLFYLSGILFIVAKATDKKHMKKFTNKLNTKEIPFNIIFTNYKTKKKRNYYKYLDFFLMIVAYLALAALISFVAILWII